MVLPGRETGVRLWYNHGYSQTHDAVRLVKAAMPQAHIIVSHDRALAPARLAADQAHDEPAIDRSRPDGAAAYAHWCLEFARQHGIDLFIVQRGRAGIAAAADAFAAQGTRLALAAGPDQLALIEDKAQFYAATAQAGLPTPAWEQVHDIAGFDAACARIGALGHGLCIKPPRGVFAAGFFRLLNDGPLWPLLANRDAHALPIATARAALAELGDAMPPMLVMQHLQGREWSIDCLCDRGRIVTGIARAKHHHWQAIGPIGPELKLAHQLAEQFRLHSLVNIQLKAASPGDADPHVLEINPRMSGGIGYAALAGVNLPALQVRHALGMLDAQPVVPQAVRAAMIAQPMALPEPAHG